MFIHERDSKHKIYVILKFFTALRCQGYHTYHCEKSATISFR